MIERVAVICPNIGIVYSGMGPDFRVLVARARKSAQAYWKMYGEYPPTRVLTQELANIMQQATHSGCVPDLFMRLKYGKLTMRQRCSAFRRITARCRLGHKPWVDPLSGRSIGIVLGLEGKCDREEHGEREDILGETVGIPLSRLSQN